jgi:adenine-specific DNA-methyltransferase
MQLSPSTLSHILKQEPVFLTKAKPNVEELIAAAGRLDQRLLSLLRSNEKSRHFFFVQVEDVAIFDHTKFERYIVENFSRSKNQRNQKSKVKLDWPERNLMLIGGQSKDDQGEEEIFLDPVLDKHKLNQLFGEKVFSDFIRYTSHGTEPVSKITNRDNIIIKADNLLALHALRKKMSNKIKLIYIDPPYNTVTDGFKYKDNFSQSTWLTFIKNRIEVAKELLSDSGFLFFHISFHQYAHSKVLLDEIFDNNYICTFNIMVRHPDRILKGDKDFHDVIEYLLVYTKNKVTTKIAKRIQDTDIDKYIYEVVEKNEGKLIEINGQSIQYFTTDDYEVNRSVATKEKLQKISIRGSLKEGNSSGRFYEKHLAPIRHKFPPNTIFKIPNMGNDMYDHRYFYTPEQGKVNGGYYQGVPINLKSTKEIPYPNFMDYVTAFNNVGYEGSVEFRNGKKPESLLLKVFELAAVKPGDIVMDFFLGSGTTAAVAHKLGIQYIGVEQMDYGANDSIHRLQAVISGEQKGISTEVNWQGGGNFLTCKPMIINDLLTKQVNTIVNAAKLLELVTTLSTYEIIPSSWIEKHISIELNPSEKFNIEEIKDKIFGYLKEKNIFINHTDLQHLDIKIDAQILKLSQQLYN